MIDSNFFMANVQPALHSHGGQAVLKDCEISFIVQVTKKQDSDDLIFGFGSKLS